MPRLLQLPLLGGLGLVLSCLPPASTPPAAPVPAAPDPAVSASTDLAAPAVPEPSHPVHVQVAAGTQDPVLEGLAAGARSAPQTWERLAELCDEIGHRFSGSPQLVTATLWVEALLREDGHSAVRRESVMVPVWTRGEERLEMLSPHTRPLAMLGLGGSVGTPGLSAPVAVIRDFSELGPHVAGHIVLYDVPMAHGHPALPHYGSAVKYRVWGATRAAEHGAVASLVRSMTTRSLYTPHTGGMRYKAEHPRIPSAAITIEDAGHIARLVDQGLEVKLRLEMEAQTHPDAESHNVIGEIRGREAPEEIILIGAHLDSWDVGQGAHDDAAGVVQVIEALRLIRAAGSPPRRTIRAVLYTNEENGLSGGRTYAREHAEENHVAAIESDLGAGWPLSWSAKGSPEALAWLEQTAAPLGMPVKEGGAGADISPLGEHGTLLIGLRPDDSSYFDIHHTHADTLDKVDPEALREGVLAMAGLAWLLAESEGG